MSAAHRREGGLDALLAALLVGLALAGFVVSSSARSFIDANAHEPGSGLQSAAIHLAAGLFVMVLATFVDYRRLVSPQAAWFLLLGVTALLVAALVVGPSVENTRRFLDLGPQRIQPSEFAKPVLVLLIAAALARAGEELRTRGGLARPMVPVVLIAGLVAAGRDLGTPVLMIALAFAMLVAAGARFRHTLSIALSGAFAATLLTITEDYRVRRVVDYLAGLSLDNIDAAHHQLRQSAIGIGSGGILGKGLGSSTQKAYFLPEANTDFVFAIVGEELGLIGALGVLIAFLLVAWRGAAVAESAPDEAGRLVALGATFLLVGQALCHMGIVTGLLPTKGLTLPFLSTGGSSLVASCALGGLILNVSLRSHGRLIEEPDHA